MMGVDFIIELQPAFSAISPLDKIPTYLKIEYDMSHALETIAKSPNEDPVEFLFKNPEIHGYRWRYIGDYSGYIDSGHRSQWLDKIDLTLYSHPDLKKPLPSQPNIEGFPTVYSTNFMPLSYNTYSIAATAGTSCGTLTNTRTL